MAHSLLVKGVKVDPETRCSHYHSEIDRIAIKFFCCGIYYPCYECHEAVGCGKSEVWPKERFSEKAVLCGACGNELTVNEYLNCASTCPACSAPFNPGCSLHKHLYFE
ncbi:CHY zinc finger protein [Planococcus shixiaomingii]|uniref:CHY zinc finger protein n=1 Tax=Planococcus shixiaomingii TaxID=3058393 RepID=UPI002617614D|nr:CHY zinc finger protein [Planococcus sp. N022]WKA54299.1 CHY zinc finger protein [Planococcus sp. N022]